ALYALALPDALPICRSGDREDLEEAVAGPLRSLDERRDSEVPHGRHTGGRPGSSTGGAEGSADPGSACPGLDAFGRVRTPDDHDAPAVGSGFDHEPRSDDLDRAWSRSDREVVL